MSRIEEKETRREGIARQRRVGEPAKCSLRSGDQQENRDTDQKEHTPRYEHEPCTTLWRHAVSVAPRVPSSADRAASGRRVAVVRSAGPDRTQGSRPVTVPSTCRRGYARLAIYATGFRTPGGY